MRPIRVYIAGPMSGLLDFNYPAFDAMAARLREAGYYYANPADIGRVYGTDKPHSFYFKEGLEMLLSCGLITLLPGWENSKGACLEATIAEAIGLPRIALTPKIQDLQVPTNVSTADMITERTTNGTSDPTQLSANSPTTGLSAYNDTVSRIIRERYDNRFNS